MDTTRTLHLTLFVLLCCQYGVSHRIYILPESGAFCLGVFSGGDCITWSEYSAHPKFADHSTTLIFTPGVYRSHSYRTLSVANIKRFTMIGDGAQLQFQLSLTNIGVVHIRNSTFTNSPRVNVRSVQSFVMENCTLSYQTSSSYSYYTASGMYIYNSNLVQIIESTFNKVVINVQSHSTLLTDRCTFINSSSATFITGDTYSRLTLNNSKFLNNYANSNGVVYTRGALNINNCLFDRNSVRYSSAAVVNSKGDVTVIGSSFIRNRASYVSSSSYQPVRYSYYEGGSAIRGERNININNCTFSLYRRSSSNIYSYRYSSYGGYRAYIANSAFYQSSRSIYSYNDVMLVNSSFYNITSSGQGGVVYSTRTVTTINCEFINSTTVNGNGGVIYSQLRQSLSNSVFIRNYADYSTGRGGALYSQQGDISITNCSISNSIANGDGGAVYTTRNVTITGTIIINSVSKLGSGGTIYGVNISVTNSTISNSRANRNGGAMYAVQNIIAVNSTINNSTASTGNGGALYSGNDVTITNNCTISKSSAAGKGGAIYSGAGELNNIFNPNVILSRSTFSSNSATSGGVLYTTGHYHHRVKFTDSTFILNEAVNGGVAHVENSSVSITDSMFSDNEAAIHGGVLNVAFASVSIRDTTLSQNSAGTNGGVFYGQNYSANFTIAHTVIDHNSAGNGGVFYIRRSNSNIKISDSRLIGNSASNQSGVMDIRGVTLTMDVDTIIANNTAGGSGNVISACVSKITGYGLEARLDPVYPLYCSIHDEGNGSRPYPMSQTISTDASTTAPTTEHIGTTSLGSTYDTAESLTTTLSEGGTTSEEILTRASSASTSSAATFTSDTSGALHTYSTHTVTSSPYTADTTALLPFDNAPTTATTTYMERTTRSNPQITDAPLTIASTETQSNADEVTTISEETTTAASATETTSNSPITSTAHGGHQDSTSLPMEVEITTTAITTFMTESSVNSIVTTMDKDSMITTDPSKFAVLQVEEDRYDTWQSGQHNLFQVATVSLTVLCIVCIAVCVMMVTLFFMACKRRKGLRLVTRGHYKKLSPADKGKEETNDESENLIEEYSFNEI